MAGMSEGPDVERVTPFTFCPAGDLEPRGRQALAETLACSPADPVRPNPAGLCHLLPPPAASLTREAQSQPGPAPRGALVQGDLAGK